MTGGAALRMVALLRLDASGPTAWTRTRETVLALEDSGVDAVVLLPGRGRVALEPVTTAAAVARVTNRLGILAFDAVGAGFPYNTARRLAALDHVAGGRGGWFAGPGPESFAGVVRELWDTWEEGAQRPDKVTGDFHDDDRIHVIDPPDPVHRVRGPLDTPRTPQGRPVVLADGRGGVPDWAGRHADLVVLPSATPRPGRLRVLDLVDGSPDSLASACERGSDGVAVHVDLDPGRLATFTAAARPWARGAGGTLRSRLGLLQEVPA